MGNSAADGLVISKGKRSNHAISTAGLPSIKKAVSNGDNGLGWFDHPFAVLTPEDVKVGRGCELIKASSPEYADDKIGPYQDPGGFWTIFLVIIEV